MLPDGRGADIFMVAFGNTGLTSGTRAVSSFGDAGFIVTGLFSACTGAIGGLGAAAIGGFGADASELGADPGAGGAGIGLTGTAGLALNVGGVGTPVGGKGLKVGNGACMAGSGGVGACPGVSVTGGLGAIGAAAPMLGAADGTAGELVIGRIAGGR